MRSNPDGSVVRLKDVARIELGAQNYQQVARFNGQPSGIIAVFQAPGSNALAVTDGVKKTTCTCSMPRYLISMALNCVAGCVT